MSLKHGIYLAGGWGYGNRGDNAIFEAMLETLCHAHPRENLLITSYSPQEIETHHGLEAIESIHSLLALRKPASWRRWLAVWFWRLTGRRVMLSRALSEHITLMKYSKVVLFGGGGYFNDAWPDMLRSMKVAIEMANSARTPVVLYGQTIGPFSDATISTSLRKILQGVEQVSYRDIQSKCVLEKAHVPDYKCNFTADEANLISARAWQRPTELIKENIIIGVMIQELRPHLEPSGVSPKGRIFNAAQYENELLDVLVRIRDENKTLSFLFIPSTTWDEKQCRRIYAKLIDNSETNAVFLTQPSTQEFIGACQSVDIMISTNMHPIILAATASRPCVAISYHYKLDDYMLSIGLQNFVVRIDNFDSHLLLEKIHQAISERSSLAKVISDAHHVVKAKARNNLDSLNKVMDAQH